MVKYKFSDPSERDMDMLFMEEFASSTAFCDLFLSEIDIYDAELLSIEHSKTDAELGESDLTVIFGIRERRIAILIEDKIDADAMPDQAGRYSLRGEKGIERGDYDEFHVFIVASEKYLSENAEVTKYPHQVSYEKVLSYFNDMGDSRAAFKVSQIEQAIHKSKTGYQAVKDDDVTDFRNRYADYATEKYPELRFKKEKKDRGATAYWTYFPVDIKGVYLAHKADRGYIDLQFEGKGNDMGAFNRLVEDHLGDYESEGFTTLKTGKSAALRLICPELDFKKPFDDQIEEIEQCFVVIKRMLKTAKKFM